MPFQDIAIVNVNLQTTTAQQLGFGTDLIIDTHAWFRERSRSYSSLTAAAVDMPTTSTAYAALTAAFAQSPQPSVVKVGRRKATSIIKPDSAVNAKTYSLSIEVTGGASVVASYTATVPTDTQQEICAGLLADITAAPLVDARINAVVVGVGAAATLEISATLATDTYKIGNLTNVSATFTTTETAADCVTAISNENDDYYFVTSTDHTEAFVLALSTVIETKKKLYFFSTQDELVLAILASPATDIVGKVKDLNNVRTVGFYHQSADTSFPECAFIGNWSTTTPGTEAWFTKTLNGVSLSTANNGTDIASPLNPTQKDNLVARSCNFITRERGVDVVYGGKSLGGEWIDVLRARDYIEDQTEVALFNLMLNNEKVPMDNNGIASVLSTCTGVWDRFISSPRAPNILDPELPYDTNFPAAIDVSFADKANRIYRASATLYLAGAIFLTELNINLTYLATS